MTGINLVIKKNATAEGKHYAILYSEIFGMHIAQVIDETTKVINTITESDKDKCFELLADYINSLGTVITAKETRPDEELVEMIKKLK